MTDVQAPYEFVGFHDRDRRSTVLVRGVPIGQDSVTLIAGPCVVENRELTFAAANLARQACASVFRAGSYRDMPEDGLAIVSAIRAETGLPVVVEVCCVEDVQTVAAVADMLQIDARNMRVQGLLAAVGRIDRPVLLERGAGSTIDEWILAAERIARYGNLDIVLCERGLRAFDISAVPIVQRLTHLPVIADPSHFGGHCELVLPLTRAAVAVGADGVIVDLHPHPRTPSCAWPQALGEGDTLELREIISEGTLVRRMMTAY